jgi:hypothetical protein
MSSKLWREHYNQAFGRIEASRDYGHGVDDRNLIAARLSEYARNKVTNKENREETKTTKKKGCRGHPVNSINLITGLSQLSIKSR